MSEREEYTNCNKNHNIIFSFTDNLLCENLDQTIIFFKDIALTKAKAKSIYSIIQYLLTLRKHDYYKTQHRHAYRDSSLPIPTSIYTYNIDSMSFWSVSQILHPRHSRPTVPNLQKHYHRRNSRRRQQKQQQTWPCYFCSSRNYYHHCHHRHH